MRRDPAGTAPAGATPAGAATARAASARATAPRHPVTLAFDIGGTGLKASVLDADGRMLHDRVRVPTSYPCDPDGMLDALCGLTKDLPAFDRISAGFPGMVREGRILTAPHFVTVSGPGSEESEDLRRKWTGFDLAGALTKRLGKPAKVANDADVAGSSVVSGKGLELVLTLGTGFGTGLFYQGKLLPHLELAHHPFRKGQTYNEQLGDAARKEIGKAKWRERVLLAIGNLSVLFNYDHLFIGGGNAEHLDPDSLDGNTTIVANSAGILGGVKLWER